MKIKRKKIERIIVTGSLEEFKKAEAHCRENGFRIVQTNPCVTDDKNRGKVISFEIWAEKETRGT